MVGNDLLQGEGEGSAMEGESLQLRGGRRGCGEVEGEECE